jgi:hypothetical protein
MPGTISEGPSVTMSFANNFWGKDDAGVEPLIQRMLHAKQTCDELKSFYSGMFTSDGDVSQADQSAQLVPLSRKIMLASCSNCLRSR